MSGAADPPGSGNELNSDLFAATQGDRGQDPVEARKKAMDYLARREYGRRELETKLSKAGFDPQVAIDAVRQLRRDGLQDDRRFADSFARSRINQGKGPARILLELSQRGIESLLIEDVLAELSVDWIALAREVRHKKFGRAQPEDFREKAKQMRFLQYRGFEQSQLQAAFRDED